jgi:hypothetical protein
MLVKLLDFPLVCEKQTFTKECIHRDWIKKMPKKKETYNKSHLMTKKKKTQSTKEGYYLIVIY